MRELDYLIYLVRIKKSQEVEISYLGKLSMNKGNCRLKFN